VYVEKTFPDAKSKGVVIGYDGRHNSYDFAHWAAATFAARGFKVYLYGKIVPTPLVVRKCPLITFRAVSHPS
jgi:phosphomannomutase